MKLLLKLVDRIRKHRIKRKLTVEISEKPENLDEIFKLRYRTYCLELGQLDPKDYPDGKEKDKYDDGYSVYIQAFYKKKLVGAMRLIKDSPYGFLMEDTFRVPSGIDRSRTVEYSRGIVKKKYRNMDIFGIMFKRALKWQIENGVATCIGVTGDENLLPVLKRVGAVQIGEPKVYHGFIATPLLLDIQKLRIGSE